MPLGLGAAALGAAGAIGTTALGSYISGEYSKGNKAQEGENMLANTLAGAIGDYVNNSSYQAIQGVLGAGANQASARGQAAAMGFNQGSADLANAIDSGRLTSQYGFNSAMMQDANTFNAQMWDKAAQWNEAMWERQAQFNAEQAQIQRDWAERMENTKYQRAITDMSAAGLNPILAATGGGAGISVGAGGGAAASVGGAQMSSAQSQMASGGLLDADSASVGGYQGQLEFTGGVMNLLATALGGIASAQDAMSNLGEFGQNMLSKLFDMFSDQKPITNSGWTDWQHSPNNQSSKSYAEKIKENHAKDKKLYGY